MSLESPTPAGPAGIRTAEGPATAKRRRIRRVTGTDRAVVALMVVVPTLFVLLLIWLPALSSVVLGFARWEGIGGLDTIEFIGLENYRNIFTNYPPFFPALQHNLIWLVFLFVATAFGIFLAALLDRELRATRF